MDWFPLLKTSRLVGLQGTQWHFCRYLKKLVNLRTKLKNTMNTNQWTIGTDDKYTTKKGYKWFTKHTPKMNWNSTVWCRANQPRHSFTMWIVIHNRLQVATRVGRFNHSISPICPVCKQSEETQEHILFECEVARAVRQSIPMDEDWTQPKQPGKYDQMVY